MKLRQLFRLLLKDKLGLIGIVLLMMFFFVAIFAEQIIPYDPMKEHYDKNGELLRMEPPSEEHWFGTNRLGRDVFSQVIAGTRVALFVGITSAVMVTIIGTVIALIAGYFGGWLDDLLMRLTDVVYGIPFLPFAMIMVAVLGPSIRNIIIAIVLISWRTTTRVIRSEVLTLKQRTFIQAAKLSGASSARIIFKHIAPNILPLSLVFGSLAMGWAIVTEASVSFLGYGDPLLISWGKILFDAYVAQAITVAWWWVVPPGLAITLLVMSGFFVSRSLEEILNPRLRKQ
ncbi:ABC transporter permease [Alkalihalobacillus sp. AL-G]|uniref:ABC transporter permease n=1 Tax=Alkalihalobacillus sp. AL-G TaxID=2926399 RepID=UPI00272A9943|nr:ABC transporter permease [Alkalihalobacillus sp. AL-G]WLD94409.1 ABC transporter permease [Alkalihalobacillus sp. AL-G]